jgi:signal peptidase I
MKKSSIIEFVKEIIGFGLLATAIVLPIRMFIAQPFIVNGESMYPTFKTGDYLIVDQLSYHLGDPKRGDVIIFKYPNDPSKFFIKRLIGLPNETVEIDGNKVTVTTVNNERIELPEDYVKLERENFQTTTLKEKEYFVMGDNRLASLDSRSWGPLSEEFIKGKALFRLLPINSAEVMPGSVEYK